MMASKQKTVRFAAVVAKAGRPRVHLTFLAAAKDAGLQSALKAHRVLTVVRFNTGTKKDYGLVGYGEEIASQVLIFPKSLKAFEDRRIIGINYDLLMEETTARARKPRAVDEKAQPRKAPPVISRKQESSLKALPRAAAKKKLPRAVGTIARNEKPVRRKIPKPLRLALWEKLEAVLEEWESGDDAEAKGMLRELIASIRKKR